MRTARVGDGWGTIADLYEAHARDLLRLAVLLCGNRAEAEELVHEAFIRYHQAGAPPRPGAEVAYLRRTVVNLSANSHRRHALARRHLGQQVVEVNEAGPSAEAAFVARDLQENVMAAIRELSYRQRVCVILHYWGGLTDVEVAESLDISPGSVKTHLHRARRILSELLEDR